MKTSNFKYVTFEQFNKGLLLSLLLMFFLCVSAFSQSGKKQSFSTKTPQATISSHLYFLGKDHYQPSVAAYTIAGDDMQVQTKVGIAIQLKQIIGRLGGIDLKEVPDKRNYKDAFLGGEKKYQPFERFPEIYLEKIGSKWLYSKQTALSVPMLYDRLFPSQSYQEDESRLIDSLAVLDSLIRVADYRNDSIQKAKTPIVKTVPQKKVYTLPKQFNLKTPRGALSTIFYFLDADHYRPELSARVLEGDYSAEEKIDLAIKFKEIIDGMGLMINFKEISNDVNYTDTTTNDHRYLVHKRLPELYLEKEGTQWVLSDVSVAMIDDLHAGVYVFGKERIDGVAQKVQRYVGETAKDKLWGLERWQVALLILVMTFGVLIYIVPVAIFTFLVKTFLKQEEDHKYPLEIFAPVLGAIIFILFFHFLPAIELPLGMYSYLRFFVRVFYMILISTAIFRILDWWSSRSHKKQAQKRGLYPFLAMVMKIVTVIFVVLILLSEAGVNMTRLLTGLSIGGIALALAAQETIKNFFGSVMILLDQPFTVGQWISVDTYAGSVEEIGLRSTRIRTSDNSVVSIPNSKMADLTINNLGRREYRKFRTVLKVSQNAPLPQINAYISSLRSYFENHDGLRENPRVYLYDVTAYSYDVLIYIYLNVDDYNEELALRHELVHEVIRLSVENNLKLASAPQVSLPLEPPQ
ncbi:mechanosensitive ion channel family protein [Persicobacter psychrovividus]|uniref:Mechanosensitive ion channel MscS domain-containing protein n=1 Tax=Persicobacter psychrovividus TaxID=387638 RepID=A0ABN6L691_9BACT|nr:hypothetical protein PEPS_05940 [Persicobacter psychrovividus]